MMTLVIQTSCRVKCRSFLAGADCNKKYYYGYVPALDGTWGWLYCKAKRNYGKLPDYSFVQFEQTPEGKLLPTKGGLDPAGIGPYDQRPEYEGGHAYENAGCNGHACRVPLIKVGTLKLIKDNPKNYKYKTYITPYQMFADQVEPDYAHIQTESSIAGCPTTYNCLPEEGLTMKRMNNLCYLASFREKPDGKPGLAGSNNIADLCNKFKKFEAFKISGNYLSTLPREKSRIFPVYGQDPVLENDFGTTHRDIFLDCAKDLTDNRHARRYVYANATIKGYEWDTLREPSTYFLIKLKTPRGGIYNNEINLKNCTSFPNFTDKQKRLCTNVLNAYTVTDGSVNYTVRFPVEEEGSHKLELIKMVDGKTPEVFGDFQFNALQSNTIVYDRGKPTEKNYTSQTRDLNLTILDFPNSKIPTFKNCKLDAFNSLEETLEDAYSLNERAIDSVKKEQVFKGLDFKMNQCYFGHPLTKHIIDENQILKIRYKDIKSTTSNGTSTFEFAFFKSLATQSATIARYYGNECTSYSTSGVNDNNMNTVALIIKDIKFAGLNNEIMEVDASDYLEIGDNTGIEVTSEDKFDFKSPNKLMDGQFFGYTLPNLPVYGAGAGRVAIILFDNSMKNLAESKITKIPTENFISIILAHELAHVWANHYMMGNNSDQGDAHQKFCTGKDECECIFRYDNLANDWVNRINKTGAKFCESHRQFLLNQLLRKF